MATTMNPYSVLVVEDNEDLVMGLQDFLRHDGYAVTVAGTVAGAVKLVRSHRFNAILLDLGLPDGDGLVVLKESQRLDPSLPVVIVTAHISPDRTVGMLKEGAYAYLTKPYDREELRHTLRRAIGVKELAGKVERTEHLLSLSEERFRSLVSNLPGAVYRCACDSDWTMEFLSDPIEQLCGYPASDFLASRVRSYGSVIHPNDRQIVERVVLGAVAQRRPYDIEYRLLHKDGGIRWVYEKGQGIFATDGQVLWLDGAIFDITERKRAEEEGKESEERYRQLTEHISEVFWMTDPAKQRMLYISPAYEDIWERSCESLYASPQSWLDAVHPEDRARILDASLRKQVVGTYDEQYRILRSDGAVRWISDRAFPIRDSSGIVYRIVGLAGDITDQVRIREFLRISEERLELVIQGSSDGFWDGRFLSDEPWSSPRTSVWWSPRVKAMLGYTDEEFPDVLESWVSRLHPEDTDRVFAAMTAHIERRVPYDVEYRLLTKAGEYGWFRARGQAIWDDTGRVVRMAGSIQDVTDRKLAEDALRRNEQLLQGIVNNTTAVIYVKYTDGRYLLINRRFEQLFHLTTDQIIGHTDHEIFPKDIADAFRANDVTVLERNRAMEYEEYAPHSDGLHTYISIKFPLCDHTGKPYATCGISTDITERKRVEDELRASDAKSRLTLTASQVGLWDWDLQTGHIYWSPDVDTLLGMAPGSVRGTQGALLALVHPDDREHVALAMRHAMESPHDDVRFEHRALQPDGSVQWCVWTGEIIRDGGGKSLHILGTVRARSAGGA